MRGAYLVSNKFKTDLPQRWQRKARSGAQLLGHLTADRLRQIGQRERLG